MSAYTIINPATNQVEDGFLTITDADLEIAVGRAHAAHAEWRKRPVAERAQVLRNVAAIYRERAEDLGSIITAEMGKPIASAIGEASFSATIFDFYADAAESLLADENISVDAGTAVLRRSSIGPLLGIMPWNYPYYQVARFAAPNLLLGNTILLKPAPQCPRSGLAIEAVFHEAGVPEDAYINILATTEQISAVIADPRVQGVSLTGSGPAGSAVAELAGRHLKKVVLELGGSDPFIVLSTDDMDSLVTKAVGARMNNTGQACNAAKRFIVDAGLYDEFVAKFSAKMASITPGDPTDANTKAGPLSSERAAELLAAQVARAVAQGATVTTGGTSDGAYYAPTVLTGIRPDMDAYHEEFFGPVAQIYRVTSEDEAVALANATEFGLGSYVFTTDVEQAQRVADQIEAGMVFVNITDAETAEMPFGGVKKSGFGRELGRLGIDEFANKKLIRTAAR